MKRIILASLSILLLAACTASPGDTSTSGDGGMNNPNGPQPGDDALRRDEVYLDRVEILTQESQPPQFSLTITGSLPTACHKLRVTIDEPDGENRIQVEVYALTDPMEVCAQMLLPFTARVQLGSYPSGHYLVFINGGLAGEFDS